MTSDPDSEVHIADETVKAIREGVLKAEEEQLDKQKAHNIIPKIREIIEQEVE